MAPKADRVKAKAQTKRKTLQSYLRHAHTYKLKPGQRAPHLKNAKRAHKWPKYPQLSRTMGTRKLQRVMRLQRTTLFKKAYQYVSSLPAIPIMNQDFEFLHLPMRTAGQKRKFLPKKVESRHSELAKSYQAIDDPEEFCSLFIGAGFRFVDTGKHGGGSDMANQDVSEESSGILGTVTEAMRLVSLNTTAGANRRKRLSRQETKREWEFRRTFSSGVADGKWEIFALKKDSKFRPGQRLSEAMRPSTALVVVTIPPWYFGSADFDDFAKHRLVVEGELDFVRNSGKSGERHNANVVWAVVYDACQNHACETFVVSTYDRWVFGKFENDMTNVVVTRPWIQPSPVESPPDEPTTSGMAASTTASTEKESGWEDLTAQELLLYWCEVARGLEEGTFDWEAEMED